MSAIFFAFLELLLIVAFVLGVVFYATVGIIYLIWLVADLFIG